MSSIQAIAKALQKSTEPRGGNYFTRGTGVVQLEKLIHKTGHKGESYIFEFSVVESQSIASFEQANPPGSTPAYVQNLKNDYAWPNIVQAVLALTGADLAEFEEKAKNSAFKAAQVKAGILGEKAPWGAAEEFEAFVKDAADRGTLNKARCKYRTNNPDQFNDKGELNKVYVNFSAVEETDAVQSA